MEYIVDQSDTWNCIVNYHPQQALQRIFQESLYIGLSELHFLANRFNPMYQGTKYVRGIQCDWWTINTTTHAFHRGLNVQVKTTIDFFFSVANWRIFTSHGSRIPIRAELTTTTNFTTKQYDTIEWIDYTDFYEGNITHDHDGRLGVWHLPDHCFVQHKPIPFPPLPLSFDADIDISSNHHTFHFREYYDFPGDRARFEVHTTHGIVYTIFDIANKQQYHIENNTCTVTAISNNSTLVSNGYLRSTSSILRFGPYYKYMGRYFAREIECDKWYTNFTDHRTNSHFVAEYYFSAEDWNMDRLGKHRIPIRIEIFQFNLNRFGRPFGDPISYFFYDYISFHVYPPNDQVYLKPTLCYSAPSLDVATGVGVGSLALFGGGIGGVFIGFILAFVAFTIINKFMKTTVKSATMNDVVIETSNQGLDEVVNL